VTFFCRSSGLPPSFPSPLPLPLLCTQGKRLAELRRRYQEWQTTQQKKNALQRMLSTVPREFREAKAREGDGGTIGPRQVGHGRWRSRGRKERT